MVVAAKLYGSFLLVVNISSKMRAAARERAENTAYPKFAQLAKYDKQGARYDPHVDYDPNKRGRPGRLSHLRTKLNRHFILQPRIRNRSRRVLARVSKPKTRRTRRRTRRRQRSKRTTTATRTKVSRHPTASRSSRPLRFAQDFARRHALV